MGCAPSKGAKVDKKESMVDKFAPPPPIPVTVGSGINRRPSSVQTIIFLFGGPGSQKGLIIEELIQQFDFVSINIEDIVFTYLPNKLANTVETTSDIQDLLKRDTGVLSVDWILSMISAKLSTSMAQRFVIDIVPALSSILKAESFQKGNHDHSLEKFERQHPVMFAMELNVCDEKQLISDQNGNVAKESKEEKDNKKELSAELNAFLRGIDEADKGRLERRLDLYHRCANGFLNYFKKTRRVVRLDIFGTDIPNLVSTVREMLIEFGFSNNSHHLRVVLFAAGGVADERFEDIDFDYYKMRKVKLTDIVKADNENLSSQVKSIQRYISRTAQPDENFVVVLDRLNNNEHPKGKRINFMERKTAYLDDFIKDKKSRAPYVRMKVAVNTISSTADNILLFLEPFNAKLATKIGLIMNENRHSDSDTYTPTRSDMTIRGCDESAHCFYYCSQSCG